MSTTPLPPCTHQAQNVKRYLDVLASITTQLTTTIYKDDAIARLENLILELKYAISTQKAAETAVNGSN